MRSGTGPADRWPLPLPASGTATPLPAGLCVWQHGGCCEALPCGHTVRPLLLGRHTHDVHTVAQRVRCNGGRALHWMAHTTLTSGLVQHCYFPQTLCIHPRTVAGPCSTAAHVLARTEHVPQAGTLQRRAASPLARCQQTHTRRVPSSHILTPWLHVSPNAPSGAAQRSCSSAGAATGAAGTPVLAQN